MSPVTCERGDSAIVLGVPHAGTGLAPGLEDRLNERGLLLADTDWHVDRLYDGLLPGATVVRATYSRYVIDANRDPAGNSLYPGQNTTGLCPVIDFDGKPIYRPGQEPGADEIADRLADFHQPYHAAIAAELERVRERHGVAVLYDCHSIRSRVPFLFEGRLPDFNVGTNKGACCAPAVLEAVRSVCEAAHDYSHVVDGRFLGGWTTRHYGRPESGLHAIQMELAQSAYLETEEPPFAYDEGKAGRLRAHLRAILAGLNDLALSGELHEEERK